MTVGELASHNHSGSAISASLTGSFRPFAANQTDIGFATEGIISNQVLNGGSGVQNTSATTNQGRIIKVNASHTHSLTINNAGGNSPHNNLSPYIAVYMFRRTA